VIASRAPRNAAIIEPVAPGRGPQTDFLDFEEKAIHIAQSSSL